MQSAFAAAKRLIYFFVVIMLEVVVVPVAVVSLYNLASLAPLSLDLSLDLFPVPPPIAI